MGESYNIGGNNEWENSALANIICEQMNLLNPGKPSYTSLLQFVRDRPGHDFRYAMDIRKIQRELGWAPQETLETGLRKTIEFYLK